MFLDHQCAALPSSATGCAQHPPATCWRGSGLCGWEPGNPDLPACLEQTLPLCQGPSHWPCLLLCRKHSGLPNSDTFLQPISQDQKWWFNRVWKVSSEYNFLTVKTVCYEPIARHFISQRTRNTACDMMDMELFGQCTKTLWKHLRTCGTLHTFYWFELWVNVCGVHSPVVKRCASLLWLLSGLQSEHNDMQFVHQYPYWPQSPAPSHPWEILE